ncbi:hypothetical protein [Cytobacillus horneckiae]|nr:hypothetical protein [Cytobacillus horneckiae]MEC1157129.1 hypothetical protein [Cytobacillus horneckiae]MED2939845.1 hypothetical protein [Cytobacillus horneckiae]
MKKGIIRIGLALLIIASVSSTASATTVGTNACSAPNIYCWEFF